ncbi:MAG: pyruvate, phosphate dikinase [Planctomycetes bacterium]|nr:pyruvate, phosphate dikinase [Planctomycetota bacterium]
MKHFYFFGGKRTEGNGKLKDILGGKGANLAEMARLGMPVPNGFTISTAVCRLFYDNPAISSGTPLRLRKQQFPKSLEPQFRQYIKRLEDATGKKLGDTVKPLFVSVRSGAKFSMPGMMDTILNIGLNDQTVEVLARKTNNPRFAYDCYRRLIIMFADVILGVERTKPQIARINNLAPDKKLIDQLKKAVEELSGRKFPQDPLTQVAMARDAVFLSWNTARAKTYRAMYKIPDDIGTAVNIQEMVFGNLGDDSATGVGFTRDPSTGNKIFYGEYLTNAQGEDVVAGIRTPKPLLELSKDMPVAFKQLKALTDRLEKHYRDIQDFEFTIEQGKLYLLQTRVGKRTGPAAVLIAVDMVNEGLISKEEAIRRVEPTQLNQLLHPIFDPAKRKEFKVIAKGLNASPGAAAGKAVFSAEDAVALAAKGERVLLVRSETSPDDSEGMLKSKGVLTATGGMTSHAAVVGRQMGKPCVVGCEALKVNEEHKRFAVKDLIIKEGDYVSIDGATGEVMQGDVPTRDSEVIDVIKGNLTPDKSKSYQDFNKLLGWADKIRRLGVEANADIPRDAQMAIKLGAKGIGLCRTEHMFFAPDRLPLMQQMILADNEPDRRKALDKLLPLQREDFVGLLDVMRGYPVTIRTIDPPLHEFLPKREELMVEIAVAKERGEPTAEKEKLLRRVEELHEFNPMMGHRGCRLGITYPEITEMQARAILEAGCIVAKKYAKPRRGGVPTNVGSVKSVFPEIMIPLVGHISEMKHQKEIVTRIAKQVFREQKIKVHYKVGTMIEIPRAALTADEIAREAEFFSFGTNDLTQMTFGFSRDDAAKFIQFYIQNKLFTSDPFVTIDTGGVGELVRMCIAKAKKTRPDIRVGICGEHGGDPETIHFCHQAGLDYVSASPFRVPIARLAAAQAALEEK